MTMQCLVMAHAAMGHNHFFKNNYLFRQWTQADAILEYLAFALSIDSIDRSGRVCASRVHRSDLVEPEPLTQVRCGGRSNQNAAGARTERRIVRSMREVFQLPREMDHVTHGRELEGLGSSDARSYNLAG